MKKRILFTGGGGAGNEAVWKLLNEKYDLYFADCNVGNIDPVIPEKRKVSIVSASSDNFIDVIISVCKKFEIDILVPTVDEELLNISRNKNLFPCEIMLPNYDFIENMLDKYKCAKSIKSHELTAPETYYINMWDKLNFPMIVKPKSGRGSRGVMVVKNDAELNAYRVFNSLPDEELIVQELGIGQEFTVFVSADKNGNINCIIPVKVEQKKGVTISAVTAKNKYIIEYVKLFHGNFNTSGIYNLQCILTSGNKVLPFEINPRISTTFCMALAAGFDPFESFERTLEELFDIEKDIRLKRNWKNTLSS